MLKINKLLFFKIEELSKYVAYNGDTFACDVAIKALKEIKGE